MNKKVIGAAAVAFLLLSNRSSARSSSGGGAIPGSSSDSYLGGNYPRGIRNNNPGNIKYQSSNQWQGKVPVSQNTDALDVDGEPKFEQFISFAYGVRALIYLIKNRYIPTGRNTLRLIVNSFAPDGGANYVNFLVSRVGISADQVISENDENAIKKIVQGIGRFENGMEAISDSQYQAGRNLL